MHPALSARVRVQGAFKHRAENRRADFAPVKIRARLFQQQRPYLLGKRRDFDVLLRKQPAVDIRERRQQRLLLYQVWVALVRLGIQDFE